MTFYQSIRKVGYAGIALLAISCSDGPKYDNMPYNLHTPGQSLKHRPNFPPPRSTEPEAYTWHDVTRNSQWGGSGGVPVGPTAYRQPVKTLEIIADENPISKTIKGRRVKRGPFVTYEPGKSIPPSDRSYGLGGREPIGTNRGYEKPDPNVLRGWPKF